MKIKLVENKSKCVQLSMYRVNPNRIKNERLEDQNESLLREDHKLDIYFKV